jgi:hypothetical protein
MGLRTVAVAEAFGRNPTGGSGFSIGAIIGFFSG